MNNDPLNTASSDDGYSFDSPEDDAYQEPYDLGLEELDEPDLMEVDLELPAVKSETRRRRRKPVSSGDGFGKTQSKSKQAKAPVDIATELLEFHKDFDSSDARLHDYVESISKQIHLRSAALAERLQEAYRICKGVKLTDRKLLDLLNKITNPRISGNGLLCIGETNGEWYLNQADKYIIQDLIAEEELNLIGGKSGVAKTVFLIFMLASILLGDEEFLGQKIVRKDGVMPQVFYFALDSSGAVYGDYAKKAGLVNEEGTGFVPGLHVIPQNAGWFMNDDGLGELEDLLKQKAPDGNAVVIIDSLSAATLPTGISENSTEISMCLMDLKRVCQKCNATPIVLLHQQKEALQDDVGTDSLRGSSNIPSFAYKVITLNHLDTVSLVGNKKLPDRKNPRRRMYAGHRGLTLDLLIEFDFDEWTLKSLGEFEEAFYFAQAEVNVKDAESPIQFRKTLQELKPRQRSIVNSLCQSKQAHTKEDLAHILGCSKETYRRDLEGLLKIEVEGNYLITATDQDVEGSNKPIKVYRATEWALRFNQDY